MAQIDRLSPRSADVVLAMSCLLVASFAGLMQPNYQGRLFDRSKRPLALDPSIPRSLWPLEHLPSTTANHCLLAGCGAAL